jgi:hypothetical protein
MQHVSRVRIASISAILLATIAVLTHRAAHAESALASFDLFEIERERILEKASAYLDEAKEAQAACTISIPKEITGGRTLRIRTALMCVETESRTLPTS